MPNASEAPSYESRDAAGLDLKAGINDTIKLLPNTHLLVPTGLVIEIPKGYEGQIRPRSGLALKHGITILNSPGTIDSDYRGEIGVILHNLGNETFLIEKGMRIAQIIISPVFKAEIKIVCEINETGRNTSGFGSTGIK